MLRSLVGSEMCIRDRAIVDLVATGKTLKENGLIKIDDLFYSTARLIGNPLSMRLDDNHLRDTILSIESTNDLKE